MTTRFDQPIPFSRAARMGIESAAHMLRENLIIRGLLGLSALGLLSGLGGSGIT